VRIQVKSQDCNAYRSLHLVAHMDKGVPMCKRFCRVLDGFFVWLFLVLLQFNFCAGNIDPDLLPQVAMLYDVLVNTDAKVICDEAPQVLGQEVSKGVRNRRARVRESFGSFWT
jgi:hypothetical protein